MKDEQIVAAVIAAAESMPRLVRRGSFFSDCNIDERYTEGACCAVGAGILYRGIPRDAVHEGNATEVFARAYGVPKAFAVGVSDGFENCIGRTEGTTEKLCKSAPYQRGWAVGRAIAVALGVDEEESSDVA